MKASSCGLLLFLSSASAMWFLSVEPTVINPGGSLNATVRVDGQDPPTCFLCIGPSNYDLTGGQVRLYCPEVQKMTATGAEKTSVAFTVPKTSPGQYRLYASKRTSASGPIVEGDMVQGSSEPFKVTVEDISSGLSASTPTVIETVTTEAPLPTTLSTERGSIHAPPAGIIIAVGVLCGIVVVVALLAVGVCVWRRRKRARKNGIAPYPAKIGNEVAYSDTFKPRGFLPNAAPIVEPSDRRIKYLQDQMRIIEAEMMKLERSRPDTTNRRSDELLGDASRRHSEGETISSWTVVGHS
ncbi:hypothetical protein PC9H_010695 [Pleurotus ostreatus]|uniref:Uncharacterized protein n=1 Tax=Pleurotus ostreatus TaxID=5322 RepID=A0A8H6ZMJ5_PLEOS|nr:uncharacterized protein PC9H_010695 [Pleurotus ostreatus]KAF7422539.1 hypothetical protein PC9H_010695 [Pleurotus ostreatus]